MVPLTVGGVRAKVRAVAVAVGVGVAGPAASLALVLLSGLLFALLGISLDLLPRIVFLLVLTQYVGFGGVAFAYFAVRGLAPASVGVRWPTWRELLLVVGGFVLAVALAIAGSMVLAQTSVEGASNQTAEAGMQNPDLFLVLIPLAFLVIGPCEELLFRGVVQRRLREAFHPAVAILLAAALFATIHFLALAGPTVARLATISLLFFPSLVLGTAYELTDNLVVSATIHAMYDALIFGVLYLTTA
ncbi:MAG: type II CAAX prenyl endopeptidase Rce1 family protein [Haloferacaceae archaeon]